MPSQAESSRLPKVGGHNSSGQGAVHKSNSTLLGAAVPSCLNTTTADRRRELPRIKQQSLIGGLLVLHSFQYLFVNVYFCYYSISAIRLKPFIIRTHGLPPPEQLNKGKDSPDTVIHIMIDCFFCTGFQFAMYYLNHSFPKIEDI